MDVQSRSCNADVLISNGAWMSSPVMCHEDLDVPASIPASTREEVVSRGQSLTSAIKLAQRVASLSPRAVNFSKGLIHQTRQGTPRHAALALERERFVDLFDGQDQREGVQAFLEKRKPDWKNA